MSTPVPDDFPPMRMASCIVGAPTSFVIGAAWNDALAFLGGRAVHAVASVAGLPLSVGTQAIAYRRSPAVDRLLVTVEVNECATSVVTMTIGCTLTGATVDALYGGDIFDAATARGCPTSGTRRPGSYSVLYDVSALSTTADHELVFVTASVTGTAKGLYSINAQEIPLGAVDAFKGVSVDRAWTAPGRGIYAQPQAAGTDGLYALQQCEEVVRKKMRSFPVNTCTLDSTTYAWVRAHVATGVMGALNYRMTGGADPRFYFRSRRHYATSTKGPTRVRVRYQSVTNNSTLRFTTSDAATTDITLTAGAGWQTAYGTLNTYNGDATNQEDYFTLLCSGTNGQSTYISALAVSTEDV